MPATDENNNIPDGGPLGFKTPLPAVGSSKSAADKGKGTVGDPQPNIFEAL